jgi:NAD(P)-dependent dehydrogenase (short-subunit alcohol dehydrogenase family)
MEESSNVSVPVPGQLPSQRLMGKLVLITGAGGAIGLETAGRLLQEGANISLVDINFEALESAKSKLSAHVETGTVDSRILTIKADVTLENEVEAYTQQTVSKFNRLDCAFLNAGISYASTSIFDTTEESYDKVMKVNVKSGMSRVAARILILLERRMLTCRHSQLSSASSMQPRPCAIWATAAASS